jgi:hypothetical protein
VGVVFRRCLSTSGSVSLADRSDGIKCTFESSCGICLGAGSNMERLEDPVLGTVRKFESDIARRAVDCLLEKRR